MRLIDEQQRTKIAARLLQYGRGDRYEVPDADDPALNFAYYDNNDAFLFAAIFDQQLNADQAWRAPYRLKRRLGHLNVRKIARMPLAELRSAIRRGRDGGSLARFPGPMADFIKRSAKLLVASYGGQAGRIWNDCLTAGEVIARMEEFPGIGPKKAHMAVRMLVDQGLAVGGFENINVAVDVHVRRVWERLRLVRGRAKVTEFYAVAHVMNPRFPGKLDEPTWFIGRGWCHKSGRQCGGNQDGIPCPLQDLCDSRLPFKRRSSAQKSG
jgi:uncharacterized HhH-GPD family protein